MTEKRDRSATRIEDDYPAGLYPHRGEYKPPEYVVYMERAAAALKTVRIIAYSGMVAFVILAAYGFFLIYQLTTDAHRMTQHMDEMRSTMVGMRSSMTNMDNSMQLMDPMVKHMANMDATTQHMAGTVSLIQHSARNLDRSFGPMMGNMNNFMPFMGGGNRGYQGAPPYSPPPPPLVTPYPTQSISPQPMAAAPRQQAQPLQSSIAPSRQNYYPGPNPPPRQNYYPAPTNPSPAAQPSQSVRR